MALTLSLATIDELLRQGRFLPASVQREFQWGSGEATRLFADLTAFMRPLGFSPLRDETALEIDDLADEGIEEPQDPNEALEPPAPAARRAEVAAKPARPAPQTARAEGYFLGQMVLSPAPRAEDAFYIYDGYQRITTLMALLSALRAKTTEPDMIEQFSALMGSDEEAPRRRLAAPTRAGTLARLIGSVEGSRLRRPQSGASDVDWRLIEVRDAFAEKIKEWDDETIGAFVYFLLHTVLVSVVSTPNRSSAYQIFVGANARGRKLAVSDIVKGKIIEVIDRSDGPEEAEKYAERWTRRRSRLKQGFDELLTASEFLRYLPSEPHAPGELLMREIDAAEEHDDFDPEPLAQDLKAWVDDTLEVHAEAQTRLRRHLSEKTVIGGDIALRRLSFLSWDEWRPVALQIDLQFAEKEQRRDRAKLLFGLQRASYALDLIDWDEAGRRAQMAKAVRQIQSGRSPLQQHRGETGPEAFGAFLLSRAMRAKAFDRLNGPLTVREKRGPIVRLLETLQWQDELSCRATDDSDVEHVLPQALKSGWEKVFTRDAHEFWCNRLGNLCILDKETNYRLQTAPWSDKRDAYREWADVFRTTGQVSRAKRWTAAEIEARHREVVRQVAEALKIAPKPGR